MLKSDRISKRRSVTILMGIGLICSGLLMVYGQVYVISLQLEWANSYSEHAIYGQYRKSILGLVWEQHHDIIISMLSLIAGLALLFRKKMGWIIGFALFLTVTIHFIWLYVIIPAEIDDKALLVFFTFTLAILFAIASMLIALPQMRQHFSIKSKEVYLSLFIMSILILDRFIW